MRPPHPIGTAAITANLLKRKWSAIILRHLENGTGDPAEICRMEPELTPMALSERLRMMFRYNLIIRDPFRVSARSPRYRLTPRGCQMLRMLKLIERIDEMNEQGEVFTERLIREIAAPMQQGSASPFVETNPRASSPSTNEPGPKRATKFR